MCCYDYPVSNCARAKEKMAATVLVHSPHAQQCISSQVEERLRRTSQLGRIRFSEFFKDFDPLKSGFITKMQFCRCLDQHLSLRLSEADYEFLVSKYGDKDKSTVNYKAFCKAMEDAFDPNILDGKPEQQIEAFQKSASPALVQTLSPDAFEVTNKLLRKCQDYYKYHGINVKSCYCDFDKHHRGLVTQSQFHRSFPGPPDVTPAEVDTLAERYYDPTTGLYNYLQFHNDLSLIGAEGTALTVTLTQLPSVPKPQVSDLNEIFQRIRDAVYKNGIRTTEFFRDHDKLRSGVITENQFICGLSLCCGRTAHLSRDDIQTVVNHYRNTDGRVRYKEFCDMMENAYNEPDLEKKPTTTVYRPLRGHLSRRLNVLESSEDERRVQEILARLKVEVSCRRLLLYPYFRDFDRGKGYTRGVTKPQFERLLAFLSLNLTSEEMKLVVRKFENPVGGDVNYPAFIQAIDEEYTGQTKQTEADEPPSADRLPPPSTPSPPVDLPLLLSRLRKHVTVNRIRGAEFFQDFDPLRSGSIAASRFRQGLSSLGEPSLTDDQFSALCTLYADPKHSTNVLWKKFVSDIDQVPSDVTSLQRPGAVDFSATVGEGECEVLEKALNRLSNRVQQRRVLTKPCFQDFDKHHNGYVTCSQFRQCLSYLGLSASDQEMKLMEMRFGGDSKGVNYVKFLEHLQPSEKLEDKYQTRMTQLFTRQTLTAAGAEEVLGPSADAESVLEKIKTQVMKERMRVLEFMKDYDKLRSGRIPATSFRRALDLCGFCLGQDEVAALERKYQSSKDPAYVDYMKFSDEIESIFTRKDLEKTPTAEVQQFVPAVDVSMYVLSPEEEQTLQKTMHRLAERVRVRRIQIFPLFEDYDRVHIGSVTRSQFHRVLSELEMGGLVNAMEFQMLYRKFDVRVGGRNDVNYIAFCQMIDDYAQTRWSDPSLK